ncbi:MAG: hypothetical protein AAGA60_01345 [Cyanobacteria bacterium P01_E01_bin.42]
MNEFQSSIAAIGGMMALSLLLPVSAQTNSPQTDAYPAGSRATFLAGCILDEDNAPNFSNREEVYDRVEICVCLSDRFQQTYSHAEFISLFAGLEQGDRESREEVGNFFRNNVPACLQQIQSLN